MDFLKSWVGILIGVGPRSVLIVEHVKSLLNMFSSSEYHMSPKGNFLGLFEESSYFRYMFI